MNNTLDFGLSEFIINHAKMNKGAVNQNPSAWSDRLMNDLHPGKEDFNIEARHCAESMVGHIDDKSLRDCDKEGAQCCEFYECPPLGIE
uniref:Uncharacterized protein n=1 Tax=Acrobeloides nanus TaxID=290746 RepID=A0A914D9B6_9BILA